MRFRNRPAGEEGASEEEPLSEYTAPSLRRPVDRGGTQPLDDTPGSPPRGSGMQVDGTDFATRQAQRRQRQSNARVYPQRFGEMARSVDNRQLLWIGGGIILLLVALLAYRWSVRDNDLPNVTAPDLPSATEPAASDLEDLEVPPAGALVTPAPGEDTGLAPIDPGADPGAAPAADATAFAAPAGQAFVVTGTGTQGLFLRPEPSTNGTPLATLPEGTRVEALGEEQTGDGFTWTRVRTPQGEGWVAMDFLVPAP